MRAKLARRLKDRRGFTLIELMMVVAMIIILATVLIPRVVTAKKDVKYAGVLQNLNALQGLTEARINSYYSKPDKLAPAIEKIVDADESILNPYTNKTGMVKDETGTQQGAIFYTDPATSLPPTLPSGDEYKGAVYMFVVKDSDDKIVSVYFYPYDSEGSPRDDERREIKP